MNIFIDFDDVLFNTRASIKDLKKIFSSHGISEKEFHDSYVETKKQEGLVAGYDLDKHLAYLEARYQFNKDRLRKDIRIFLKDMRSYVFEDALEFLRNRMKNKDNIYVISYGASDYQNKKIEGARIGKYFSEIVVGDIDKGEVIQGIIKRTLEDHVSWFIDDRVEFLESVKKSCGEVRAILVSRAEGRYCDIPNEFCDHHVGDLEEVQKLISARS